MKETLQQLIELQRLDDSITEMQTRIDELHKELVGAQKALEKAQAGVDAAHHRLQESQAATHSKETDLQGAEQEIDKLNQMLNKASSNKEYQAILLKIGTIKAENGKLEDLILAAMDVVDEKEREQEAAKTVQREAEATLREAEAQVEAMRATLAGELQRSKDTRKELAAKVDPEKLTLYERIRGGNRKSGTAVVAVHGEYCQGCQMAVRPQDITGLVKGDKIVLCRSCQRILVLET